MRVLRQQTIDLGAIRAESGKVEVFSHFPSGYMWTGVGPREIDAVIPFQAGFRRDPVVQASIAALDSGNVANTRVDVNVVSVTRENFVVRVTTWADTKLATVHVSWTAIGRDL